MDVSGATWHSIWIDRSVMNKLFWDARGKGRLPDAKVLLDNFSLHVPELHNTFVLVARVQGTSTWTMEIQETFVPFKIASEFRVYHRK